LPPGEDGLGPEMIMSKQVASWHVREVL